MKIGDIIKTPEGAGIYSNLSAIVLKKEARAVTVHTGTTELIFEPEVLRPHGVIKLGRSYGKGVRRFRVCVYTGVNGAHKEVHVITRDVGALGEETRALEVRKLAFKELKK